MRSEGAAAGPVAPLCGALSLVLSALLGKGKAGAASEVPRSQGTRAGAARGRGEGAVPPGSPGPPPSGLFPRRADSAGAVGLGKSGRCPISGFGGSPAGRRGRGGGTLGVFPTGIAGGPHAAGQSRTVELGAGGRGRGAASWLAFPRVVPSPQLSQPGTGHPERRQGPVRPQPRGPEEKRPPCSARGGLSSAETWALAASCPALGPGGRRARKGGSGRAAQRLGLPRSPVAAGRAPQSPLLGNGSDSARGVRMSERTSERTSGRRELAEAGDGRCGNGVAVCVRGRWPGGSGSAWNSGSVASLSPALARGWGPLGDAEGSRKPCPARCARPWPPGIPCFLPRESPQASSQCLGRDKLPVDLESSICFSKVLMSPVKFQINLFPLRLQVHRHTN